MSKLKVREIENEKFINPYTFVPLPEVKQISATEGVQKNLYGYLDCSIQLKTDLFIPNASFERAFIDDEEHKSYEFYSYDQIIKTERGRKPPKNPVIPGSEIRGVVRSVYEVITDSCLGVQEDKLFSARIGEIKKPAILKYDGKKWRFVEVKREQLNEKYYCKPKRALGAIDRERQLYVKNKKNVVVRRRHGNKDFYKVINKKKKMKGFLVIGEPMQNKKYESVFIGSPEAANEKIDEIKVRKYIDIINNFYANSKINTLLNIKDEKHPKEHKGYRHLSANVEKMKGKLNFVWFSKVGKGDNKKIYLSPACLGREIYDTKVYDLLNDLKPCLDAKENICHACDLFGMVSPDSIGKSKATRVRFTDAHLIKDSEASFYSEPITIKPLGGSKISSFEFYTHLIDKEGKESYEGVNYWTPDYYINKDKKKVLYDEKNGKRIKLNGRKFYWHNPSVEKAGKDIYQKAYDEDTKKVSSTIRPLKPSASGKNEFTFRVYFDGVSEMELKRLIYSLNLEDREKSLCHKIGKGKPLGLGSVKVNVKKLFFRKFNIKANGEAEIINEENKRLIEAVKQEVNLANETAENNLNKIVICGDETHLALRKVLDYNAIDEPDLIKYPVGRDSDGNEEIFNWFSYNRNAVNNLRYRQRLKKCIDNEQTLKYNEKVEV